MTTRMVILLVALSLFVVLVEGKLLPISNQDIQHIAGIILCLSICVMLYPSNLIKKLKYKKNKKR